MAFRATGDLRSAIDRDAPARAEVAEALASLAELTFFLTGGGDERIAVDPLTGCNRYGASPAPRPCDIWLSSSTATSLSPRGQAAARLALKAVAGAHPTIGLGLWHDVLRQRVRALLATPESEVVFCASGTQAEFLALAAALMRARGAPLTNILVAPDETGRGVVLAAAGRHFLDTAPFDTAVASGAVVEGWERSSIHTATVAIRDAGGAVRACADVDAAIVEQAEAALARGHHVLLHVLDVSKSGLRGRGRAAAATLAARHGARVSVVVDACQLRTTPEALRGALGEGQMVMITGSKFAAGPAFSGALLLPPGCIAGALDLPPGLAAHVAACDLPDRLREGHTSAYGAIANIGLALRWEAALAEMEPFFAHDRRAIAAACAHFGKMVRAHVAQAEGLALVDDTIADRFDQTIFCIETLRPDGSACDAAVLQRALRGDAAGRAFHVGQPVTLGPRTALRICASMPMLDALTTRLATMSAPRALAPLQQDLDDLFVRWQLLAATL